MKSRTIETHKSVPITTDLRLTQNMCQPGHRSIEDLKPSTRNPRTHAKKQVAQINDPAVIAPSAKIFDDEAESIKVSRAQAGRSTTWFELTRSAFVLSGALSETLPRRRGRS